MAGNEQSPMPVRDLVLLTGVALVGLAAVWDMYAHLWLALATLVALIVATALARFAVARRWRLWVRVVAGFAAYLIVGALVAAPEQYRDIAQVPGLLLGVLTAPVTGWKDLLTLDLPLGVYQSTLAPTVFLFTILPYTALQVAWGSRRWWPLAAPAMLLLTVYGIAFGSSDMRPLKQMVVGLAAFVTALVWLVWRSSAIRRRALITARDTALGRVPRREPLTRLATGLGVVAAATAVGMLAAPTLVSGHAREVLRTGVDPAIVVQQRITPLTTYRDFFTDDRYDEILFRIDAPAGVDRVTLATLASFDGTTMHVAAPDDHRAGAFTRVPSTVSRADEVADVTITIEDYADIWVPIAGELHAIDFRGAARSALGDGFFYQQDTGTGVQLASAGLSRGITIHETVTSSLGTADDIRGFTPARPGSSGDPRVLPEALADWVNAQGLSADGAGLVELVERLRSRGMLSHALTVGDDTPAWAADLGDYAFAPSRAGHSTDRINRIFTELNEREGLAGPNASPHELVAASGDDEQFAVAAALLADYLGFDARVAVGFRLAQPEGAETIGVSPCDEGACRGGNLAAWVEVRDAKTGQWAELVTTPQHDLSLSRDLSQRSDPKHPTEPDERSAELVPPLDANPSDATERQEDEERSGLNLAWLLPALRIVAVTLLALLIAASPFLAILALKRLRRRARQRLEYPSDRVAAAWEEYVDVAIDHGMPFPAHHTRSEIVDLFHRSAPSAVDVSRGGWLAAVADHADFSAEGASSEIVQPYWDAIAEEHASLKASHGRVARMRAAVSLRSLRYWFNRIGQRADILDGQAERAPRTRHSRERTPTRGTPDRVPTAG